MTFYLGDFSEDAELNFTWNSCSAAGASAAATGGTVYVYQDDDDATETVTGLTEDRDFDGLTGVNQINLDLSAAAFYATGHDYEIIADGLTIDGQTVNATLATFSIENRSIKAGDQMTLENGSITAAVIESAAIDADAIAGSAITSAKIAANAITATQIASDAITAAKIAANAIGASEIAAGAITDAKIAASAITADKIASNAITAAKIASDAITAAKVADDTITTDQLADGTITAAKIAANAIGASELATDAVNEIRDAIAGADGDTLETLSNQIDSVGQLINVIPSIPHEIDLANTSTVRMGLILTKAIGDLPTAAEITQGTIDIDRKAIGGTSWTSVLADEAMTEQDGMVYYDEVFNTITGYAEGDSIRITFKGVSITSEVPGDEATHEICDSNGIMFQTTIKQTMRGTDSAATVGAEMNLADDAITAAKIADDSITTDQLADGTITAAKLGADAITAAKIADDAIASEHFASGAITADAIASNAITSTELADGAITAAKIAADAITEAKIADDAIATEHLAAGAITADTIGADAITEAKIADDAIGADQLATSAVNEIVAGLGAGENPNVLLTSEITSVDAGKLKFILTSGSDESDAYNDQAIVLYDDDNNDYPSVRVVTAYNGATKEVTIDETADFILGADDSVQIFVTAPGTTAPTAAAVAATVLEKLISDHESVDGSLADFINDTYELLYGNGGNTVDITVQTSVPALIPDVRVVVKTSDGLTTVCYGTTDGSGEVSFNLADGTYLVYLKKGGYSFAGSPETLVVDGNESETYVGTVISVAAPSDPDVCKMYEFCLDQDGDPLTSVTSEASIIGRPYDDGGAAYEITKQPGTYLAGTGELYWEVVYGAKVSIDIADVGLAAVYTVPDQATARLGDLTPE